MIKEIRAIAFHTGTILAILLMHRLYVVFQAFHVEPPRNGILIATTIECLILFPLFVFIIRGNREASWVVAILMWQRGVISSGLVLFEKSRSISSGHKTLVVVLGIYFIIGGFILVRRVSAVTPNQAL